MDALQRFAADRGLEHRGTGTLEGPFALLRRAGRVEGLVRGALADGRKAALAAYTCTEEDPEGGLREHPYLVVLCAVPESSSELPWLTCRSREAEISGGPGAAVEPPLGAQPIELESEFFAQRFELLAGPGTDPNAVVQLFAPSFLHWYAYEAPFGLSLKVIGGRLCASAPGAAERIDRVRSLWDATARIVTALTREGLESSGLA